MKSQSTEIVQRRYWKELIQLRFEIFYLEHYLLRSNRINLILDVLLAVSSSSSIAGWAIWNSLGFIWAILIAASQVIQALRHLLPFKKRVSVIKQVVQNLETAFIRAEENWYYIANGELEISQINKRLMSLKKEKDKLLHRNEVISLLGENKRFVVEATQKTKQFFNYFYPGNGAEL